MMEFSDLQSLLIDSKAGEVLDLDVLNRPLQPTVQGWLLGYPAVYFVTEENVSDLSSCLSSQPLMLLTLNLSSDLLKVKLLYTYIFLILFLQFLVISLAFRLSNHLTLV